MTYKRIDPDGERRPQLETVASTGYYGIVVRELGTTIEDGTYIYCEHPVEARE